MFTRNASEAVNLVAHAWGTANLKPGDEVRCWVQHPLPAWSTARIQSSLCRSAVLLIAACGGWRVSRAGDNICGLAVPRRSSCRWRSTTA